MKTQSQCSVSFNVSRVQTQLIAKIVDRAMGECRAAGFDRMDLMMDLTACIANGCPLHLGQLLQASPGDFAHDVCGISMHIDRHTGHLRDHFCPRFFDNSGRPHDAHSANRILAGGRS